MRYTYGDLSDAEFDFDLLGLARAVVEYSAEVMRSAERIDAKRQSQTVSIAQRQTRARSLEDVHKRLQRAIANDPDASEDLRAALALALEDEISRERDRGKDALVRAQSDLDGEIDRERDLCVAALERLLCRHTLPQTWATLVAELTPTGRYSARLAAETELGAATLRTSFELDTGSAFSAPLTAGDLVGVARYHVPARGLLGRAKWQRRDLSSCVVARVAHGADATEIRLVAADGQSDYTLSRTDGQMRIVALDADSTANDRMIHPGDVGALTALFEAVLAKVVPMAQRRAAMTSSTIDDTSVREICDVEIAPLRIIDALAPLVAKAWRRSPGEDHLVIGARAANGVIERHQLALDDLRTAIAPLSSTYRGAFSSWELPLFADSPNGKARRHFARGSTPPIAALVPQLLSRPVGRRTATRPASVDLDSSWPAADGGDDVTRSRPGN